MSPPGNPPGNKRRLLLAAGGLAVAAIVAVVVIVLMADDSALRDLCLADPEGADINESRAACRQLIESGEYEGAELAQWHMAYAGWFTRGESPGRALHPYRDAVEADPDLAAAWRGIANLTTDTEERRTALDNLIRLQPDDAVARGERGRLLLVQRAASQGEFETARDDLRAALDAAPDDIAQLTVLGFAEASLGETEAALGHLERAIALLEEDGAAAEAYALDPLVPIMGPEQLLGTVLIIAEQYDDATAVFQRARAIPDNSIVAPTGEIVAACRSGDVDAAWDLISTAAADGHVGGYEWRNAMFRLGYFGSITITELGHEDHPPAGIGPETRDALGDWIASGCPFFFPLYFVFIGPPGPFYYLSVGPAR